MKQHNEIEKTHNQHPNNIQTTNKKEISISLSVYRMVVRMMKKFTVHS